MMAIGDSERRHQALQRLKDTVASLDASTSSGRDRPAEQFRLLNQLRAAVRNAEEVLDQLEHHVRGPLTVVKGRAQLLRRQARAAPRPDQQLISGLDEIDSAVDRIVLQLDRLLREPNAFDHADASVHEGPSAQG
jgi:nitrogen-specific signal transduction histidine kinase